ncbi:unnamed protein product [Fusarium graminearum]|uniref:Chromosome 2, complete genome n=1 Tax=Gibberella zeae (strain ATCC MYA-4620 / CBS 123657 / FGSC 9075 / NRRL 31084 / PH-1) TaxID=229533 RepID=A0A098DBW4_GIBZE|nr:unnamed protein product [Fusarium graminearum]CEF76418.1 unnamed protein product [Fusarium graminearum]
MRQVYLPFSKAEIDEDTIADVGHVLRSGWLTNGPKVEEFEKMLSDYFGGRQVRTFNSGTSSLEIGLRVAGIRPGDHVITTPISWVATANVILAIGATPVFADIDRKTRNIDLEQVEKAITQRTKAIIPVHLAGRPVDMDRLYDLANKYNLRVIEDAAQAIGSTWKGKRIGSFGDIVSFSFQATKNITTGEGGCLVLNDEKEAALAEKLRFQGMVRSGYDGMEVDVLGGKHNMNEIAATIGLGQFGRLEEITAKRHALAQHYFTSFGPDFEQVYEVQLPLADTQNSNWHLFQLVLPNWIPRPVFQEDMKKLHQIGIGCHYPAIHIFKLYREQGFREGMFPVAEQVGRSIVTLPMFPSMAESDVERVVFAVRDVFETHR